MAYASMSDWLNELEGFGLRIERVPEDAMPWIETAWRLATEAEREACASKAREFASHYSPGSDGLNTFVLFAEWIENRATAQS